VTFSYAGADDVLRVPSASLRFRPPPEMVRPASAPAVVPSGGANADEPTTGHRRTLWALRAGEAVPVAVQTGASDGSMTEITSGELEEGDEVVLEASTSGKAGKKPGSKKSKGIF
jgi:HlyD family secretion protein